MFLSQAQQNKPTSFPENFWTWGLAQASDTSSAYASPDAKQGD